MLPAALLTRLSQARHVVALTLLIELNPVTTPLTPHADATLSGPAGELLPELAQQLKQLRA
jgi:hypothetical protein